MASTTKMSIKNSRNEQFDDEVGLERFVFFSDAGVCDRHHTPGIGDTPSNRSDRLV